jgi:PadR family transcriptional regulator AphA
VLTIRRPLVYRALDHLVELGLAEASATEPGTAGPQRTIHRITPEGRRSLNRWLAQPVGHIRHLRIEFQLKLALLQRLKRSPLRLVTAQRKALEPTLAALEAANGSSVDHVELWRHHNASAVGAYLEHLERIYRAG